MDLEGHCVEEYSRAWIIRTENVKFVLINRACKLKRQFNVEGSVVCVQNDDANYPGGTN